MQDLIERRDAIRADLMAHPERRGTAWYDDRINEVHALTRSIWVREDAVAYRDASSEDRNERWVILRGDDVIGAGPTEAKAWADATAATDDELVDIEASRRADRDARELRTARIAILAGLASAREWGAPLGAYRTA